MISTGEYDKEVRTWFRAVSVQGPVRTVDEGFMNSEITLAFI